VTDSAGNYRIDCGFGRYEGPIAFEADGYGDVIMQIPGDATSAAGQYAWRLDVELTRRAN
jgi:hypothetical protein